VKEKIMCTKIGIYKEIINGFSILIIKLIASSNEKAELFMSIYNENKDIIQSIRIINLNEEVNNTEIENMIKEHAGFMLINYNNSYYKVHKINSNLKNNIIFTNYNANEFKSIINNKSYEVIIKNIMNKTEFLDIKEIVKLNLK